MCQVKAWAQLLKDIVADPVSQQRVMVDILNEPDSRGLECALPLFSLLWNVTYARRELQMEDSECCSLVKSVLWGSHSLLNPISKCEVDSAAFQVAGHHSEHDQSLPGSDGCHVQGKRYNPVP